MPTLPADPAAGACAGAAHASTAGEGFSALQPQGTQVRLPVSISYQKHCAFPISPAVLPVAPGGGAWAGDGRARLRRRPETRPSVPAARGTCTGTRCAPRPASAGTRGWWPHAPSCPLRSRARVSSPSRKPCVGSALLVQDDAAEGRMRRTVHSAGAPGYRPCKDTPGACGVQRDPTPHLVRCERAPAAHPTLPCKVHR